MCLRAKNKESGHAAGLKEKNEILNQLGCDLENAGCKNVPAVLYVKNSNAKYLMKI